MLLFLVLISLCVSKNNIALEKLIFTIDFFRHGDRTPIVLLSKKPYREMMGSGELTPFGMQKMYRLGTKFHKIYIDDYHLLPSHYRNEVIHVYSTDFNRTLMSAQSFLLGLYPLGTGPYLNRKPALPRAYQPIPIHVIPEYQVISEQELLMKISNYFLQAAQKQTPLKSVLFFGHDTTLSKVINALQFPLTSRPPYASNVNFSLFKKDHEIYFVKIFFNNQPMIIPPCKNDICYLSTFLEFIAKRTQTGQA